VCYEGEEIKERKKKNKRWREVVAEI